MINKVSRAARFDAKANLSPVQTHAKPTKISPTLSESPSNCFLVNFLKGSLHDSLPGNLDWVIVKNSNLTVKDAIFRFLVQIRQVCQQVSCCRLSICCCMLRCMRLSLGFLPKRFLVPLYRVVFWKFLCLSILVVMLLEFCVFHKILPLFAEVNLTLSEFVLFFLIKLFQLLTIVELKYSFILSFSVILHSVWLFLAAHS